MALKGEITSQITDLLRQNPQGLSITEIVRIGGINRNTAGRYLDNLLISGKVEMRHFGMAKIYSLSQRLPVSSVLSISSEFVMQLDRYLRVMYANEPFIRFLGTTQKDLFGKNIQYSVLVPVFDDLFGPFMENVRNGIDGVEWHGELFLRQQGIIFACRIAPTVFDNGHHGVSVILEDITRRKEDGERIQKSEELYRSLAESSQDLIFVIDGQDRVEYVNSYAAAALQKPPEEIISSDRGSMFPPDINRRQEASLHRVFSTGRPNRSESAMSFPGTTRWFDHILVPLRNPDGSVRAVLGVSRDITDRKRAEEALRESEEKFRALFNNANDMITLHGFDRDGMPGQYLEVNDVACRRLKYTRDELLAMSPGDIVAPESAGLISRNAQQLRENGHATFELVHLTKDRQRIPAEVSAHIFDFNGKSLVLALVRDITERKSAEEKRTQKDQQYRLLAENSVDIINRLTPECVCTFVSPAVMPVLGYREEDVLGKSMLEMIHPDDLAMVRRDLAAIAGSGIDRKTSTFRFRHRDGHYLWFESTTRIIRDEKTGRVQEFLSISRDITSRQMQDPAGCP
jgi:PAS domain S-box-containing protein